MYTNRLLAAAMLLFLLLFGRVWAQDVKSLEGNMQSTIARSERFVRKAARRTAKAEKRMEKYTDRLTGGQKGGTVTSDNVTSDKKQPVTATEFQSKIKNNQSKMAREPQLDSLRLAYGFAEQAGIIPNGRLPGEALQSLDRAQQQLDITAETKKKLQQERDYWKGQLKEYPEYGKIVGKMDKEAYYYSAQINEYRKKFRDPTQLQDAALQALKKDPRWASWLASLPTQPQNPEKMQTKDMVNRMMKSQASAIDPEGAMELISDARKKGSELLGKLSKTTGTVGNLDNAAQVPAFKPNPYKTKSIWDRFDFGFGLQFDNRTYFLPSSGVAGAQVSFNFTEIISAGALANYRFGLGKNIKNIKLTHSGWGYGVFVNGTFWKGFGVQGGFERNYRTAFDASDEISFDACWTSAALLGITKEYSIGKKAKGTVAVFYDFLHKRHIPQTNAVVWRTGWKF